MPRDVNNCPLRACRVGITEPSALSALRKLEKNGFVRKTRNARDRRANTLYLTEAGQNLEGELMHHAANHGVHHRGQVALLLRELGHTPGNVDILFYYADRHGAPA